MPRNYPLSLRRWSIALFTVVILTTGSAACTLIPSLSVDIDSINGGELVSSGTYTLNPVVKDVGSSDLRFLEYSKHIHKALARKGLSPAEPDQLADISVDVNYGVTRYDRTVSRPIFRNSEFYNYPRKRQCRQRDSNGRCRYWHRYPVFYDHYRHRDLFTPHRVDVVPGFRVFITLEAYATDAADDTPALWSTRARALVRKPDLRTTLPLLLAAARDYVGTDTGHEVTVNLRADDPALSDSE